MGREKRKNKRAARKQRRSERRQKKQELFERFEQVIDINIDDDLPNYEERFDQIWPFVKAALNYIIVLKLTPARADRAMERIIAVGDNMLDRGVTDSGSSEIVARLDGIWEYIEPALEFIIDLPFTGGKFETVLEKVLEIGDWILDTDDD